MTIIVPSKELTEHEKKSTLSSLVTARAMTHGTHTVFLTKLSSVYDWLEF